MVVGNVTPPSVDSLIFTFWQLIVAFVVCPTAQLIVTLLPGVQFKGLVTVKGVTSSTVIFMVS